MVHPNAAGVHLHAPSWDNVQITAKSKDGNIFLLILYGQHNTTENDSLVCVYIDAGFTTANMQGLGAAVNFGMRAEDNNLSFSLIDPNLAFVAADRQDVPALVAGDSDVFAIKGNRFVGDDTIGGRRFAEANLLPGATRPVVGWRIINAKGFHPSPLSLSRGERFAIFAFWQIIMRAYDQA